MSRKKRLIALLALPLMVVALAGCQRMRARLGDSRAQYELAKSYREGRGVPKDLSAATRWFGAACKQGHGMACEALGSNHDLGQGGAENPATLVKIFQQGCGEGAAEGCLEFAKALENGVGVQADPKKALFSYEKACNAGIPAACHHAALLYASGRGASKDMARAAALLERACGGGETAACSSVSRMLFFGIGIPKDETKAKLLYKEARKVRPEVDSIPRASGELALDTPVFLGPEGVGFWTTLLYAQFMLGNEPLPATIRKFNGRIASGQDQTGNVWMMVEEKDRPSISYQLAEADGAYVEAPGEGLWMRCLRTPVAGAPWLGVVERGFYLKRADKQVVKIGIGENRYRRIDGRATIMVRGLMDGEPFMGSGDGVVYKLVSEQPQKVGEFSRFWVTPSSSKPLPIPIVMARSAPGARWVGEYGGSLYVQFGTISATRQ